MPKAKRKQVSLIPPKTSGVKEKFIKRLNGDRSIDWDRKILSERSLVLDVLYLLGVSIDEKKYAQYSGLREFAKIAGVELDLKKEKEKI